MSDAAVVDPEAGKANDGDTIASVVADPARPDGFDDDLWDATANAPKLAEIAARLTEHKTLKDAAASAVIAESVDKIDWTLPDVKGADGKPVEFDTEDPLFKAVGEAVVAHKVPMAQFKPLLAAFAQAQMQQDEAARAELTVEMGKLGEKGRERVQAAAKWAAAAIGETQAATLFRSFTTAAQVEAIEKLMEHYRDPNPGGGVGASEGKTLGQIFYPTMTKDQ